jgi:hypothetical protein
VIWARKNRTAGSKTIQTKSELMPEPLFVPGQMVSNQVGEDTVTCMEHDVRNSDDVPPTKQCFYETPRRVRGITE